MNYRGLFKLSVLMLALGGVYACSENNDEDSAECTQNSDCATRDDGKTECNTDEGVCVAPTTNPECTGDADCSSRTDGKTKCDTANKVCVAPTTNPECTDDTGCSARTDGKTKCDSTNKVCVAPTTNPECTADTDCSSRTDGKTKCDTTNKVCVVPTANPECTADTDCSSRTDGKTKCDTTNNVCVTPTANPECTADTDCSARTDGKTQCDTTNNTCVAPTNKCKDKQEWNDTLALCVYPLSSKSDIESLANTWNSKGKNAYPSDSDEPVFLIKDSINMGTLTSTWKGIGSSLKPFSGTVYGDGNTITVSFSKSAGLFGYTKDANIQDLNMSVTANGTSGLIANSVEGGSFKGIGIEGSAKFSDATNTGVLFNEVAEAEFDNIMSTVSSTLQQNSTKFNFASGYFAYKFVESHATNLNLKGEVSIDIYNGGMGYSGFAYSFEGGSLTNSKIAHKCSIKVTAVDFLLGGIAFNMCNDSKVDAIELSPSYQFSRTTADPDDMFSTIAYDASACTACSISNIEDVSTISYSAMYLKNSAIRKSSGLVFSNSLVMNVDDSAMPADSNSVTVFNVAFAKGRHILNHDSTEINAYFYSDWDNGTVNADLMNGNLRNPDPKAPKGTYLPWKGALHLDFKAKDSDKITIK